jgi:hypothetical protein
VLGHIFLTALILVPRLVVLTSKSPQSLFSSLYKRIRGLTRSRGHSIQNNLKRSFGSEIETGSDEDYSTNQFTSSTTTPWMTSIRIRNMVLNPVYTFLLNVLVFGQDPFLFYPVFIFHLYILVGPWCVGAFVPSSGKWGYMFTYGLIMNGRWVPMLETWLYG